LRFIEPQHDVALLDAIALLHAQFANHAARRVLDLLDVRIDNELARGDHRARQFGRRGPAADAADKHERCRRPHEKMAVNGAPVHGQTSPFPVRER